MAKLRKNDISEQSDDNETTVQSVCMVRRTFTKSGKIVSEDQDVEYIAVHKFVTTPAEVGITYGSTRNLGNFEAARIDIWCKIPAYKEEMEEAFEFARAFADEKMNKEMSEINETKTKHNKDFNPF